MKISGDVSNYSYGVPSVSETPKVNPIELQEQKPQENKMAEVDSKRKEKKDMTEESVIQAIEKANKQLEMAMTNLKFSIHKETKQIMVKVIDSKTQEVIREIPPEKVLDMVAKMWERAGLFVDKKS